MESSERSTCVHGNQEHYELGKQEQEHREHEKQEHHDYGTQIKFRTLSFSMQRWRRFTRVCPATVACQWSSQVWNLKRTFFNATFLLATMESAFLTTSSPLLFTT